MGFTFRVSYSLQNIVGCEISSPNVCVWNMRICVLTTVLWLYPPWMGLCFVMWWSCMLLALSVLISPEWLIGSLDSDGGQICVLNRNEVQVKVTQITKFMGPTWGPPGSCRPQMGPMMAPWALLSGYFSDLIYQLHNILEILRPSLCEELIKDKYNSLLKVLTLTLTCCNSPWYIESL